MKHWINNLSVLMVGLTTFIGVSAVAQETAVVSAPMQVVTIKDQPSTLAPAEYFTGTAKVARLITGEDPSDLTCGSVEFQPGARSNWHTHPKGQLLIITKGHGLVQEWGKPARKIKAGDVVWTPPNVKHWHGAAVKHSMTHTAVTETQEGKAVEWMERVTDEQYKSETEQKGTGTIKKPLRRQRM